ncbi:MAG: hypothetical protein ACRDLB_16500 [Actinomycetota bacterium]
MLLALAVAITVLPGATAVAQPPSTAPPNPPHPITAEVDGKIADWKGSSPMVGGESVVSEGEFIYQDYLHDDMGAAVGDASVVRDDASSRGTHRAGVGTYMYPNAPARYGNNAADISQFRVVRDGSDVHFLVVLNTLLDQNTTVVGIALGDADDERLTWPLDAGISTPGTDHVITAWGGGAMLDGMPIEAVGGAIAADLDDNAFEISLPISRVGPKFRAYVASGLWDDEQKRWMQVEATRTATRPGGGDGEHPNVFNVAFRHDEASVTRPASDVFAANFYWERAQAAALAAGNIDKYYADIDLTAADTPPRTLTGAHQRIYPSSARLVPPFEGISETDVPGWRPGPHVGWNYDFLGPWQTYDIYVPEEFDRMTVLLHGSGWPTFGTPWWPGIQRDLGDATGSILVDPLALGPHSGFADYSELAVLEAMDDAQRHYTVDPAKTVLGGISMGGVGTHRMLGLHPDLFAGGIVWSGCSGNPGYCTGTYTMPSDLFPNYRNTEVFMHKGVTDWLLPAYMTVQDAARLEALGYPYKMALFAQGEHNSISRWDRYRLEADFINAVRIDSDPVRVTYRTSEEWWRPEISPRLVYDHAYWVSGLRVRDTALGDDSYGSIDATTRGLGRDEYTTKAIQPTVSTGAEWEPESCPYTGNSNKDMCMTHTFSGREKVPGVNAPRQNSFEAELSNLRAAALDMQRMGLSTDEPLIAEIRTDGPVDVTILGTGPVDVNGVPVTQQDQDVVLHFSSAGTYTVTLTGR